MPRIIERHEWGARAGDGVGWSDTPVPERWLHHSVTSAPPEDASFEQDADAVRHIENIGVSRFGWSYGVPYSYVVPPSGRIFRGHGQNRQGAHTGGRNGFSRAICVVGDYHNRDHLTSRQRLSIAWLLNHEHEAGVFDAPSLTGGHRDVKATACPGDHAYAEIDSINNLARAGGGGTPGGDMATHEDTWYTPTYTEADGTKLNSAQVLYDAKRAYEEALKISDDLAEVHARTWYTHTYTEEDGTKLNSAQVLYDARRAYEASARIEGKLTAIEEKINRLLSE